jgi:hypothetical protein
MARTYARGGTGEAGATPRFPGGLQSPKYHAAVGGGGASARAVAVKAIWGGRESARTHRQCTGGRGDVAVGGRSTR